MSQPDLDALTYAELCHVQAALNQQQPHIQWLAYRPITNEQVERRIKMLQIGVVAAECVLLLLMVTVWDAAWFLCLFLIDIVYFHITGLSRFSHHLRQHPYQIQTVTLDFRQRIAQITRGKPQAKTLLHKLIIKCLPPQFYRTQQPFQNSTLPPFYLSHQANTEWKALRDTVQNHIRNQTACHFQAA